MKVYIVMGSTGEYSDHNEWPVGAFFNEDAAKERVSLASEKAREFQVNRVSNYADPPPGTNPYDPDMVMDYTGTNYSYWAVDVMDAEVTKP